MKMKRCGAKKSRKEKKTRVEVEVMDEGIWKEFPQDLLEVVIARLPITTFIRLRLVCQKWNSLPKSPSFQQLWANFAPQKQPLFFAVARAGDGDAKIGALYDPSMKKWRHTNHIPPSSYLGLFSAASSGGLVCYTDRIRGSFWVGNFLTQTCKEFPWPSWTESNSQWRDVVVGMVTLNQDYSKLSARAGGYKLVWADARGNYQVYDSLKEDSTSGRIPTNIKLPSGFKLRTVSIDTVVYFLARKPDGIISYDMVSGAWEQLLIPDPPDSYSLSLAECGGRILLAGMVLKENSAHFFVCVWELETAMLRWTEVDRMPSSWCSEFSPDLPLFACLANRRVLVMSLFTDRRSWILTYDVVSRDWSKAPRFSIPGRYPRIMDGVGFFPCLSAFP